jgi:hypothetical protein
MAVMRKYGKEKWRRLLKKKDTGSLMFDGRIMSERGEYSCRN